MISDIVLNTIQFYFIYFFAAENQERCPSLHRLTLRDVFSASKGKTPSHFLYCFLIDFSRLLMTSANSLDPDRDRQNVGPDLDPDRLTI